MSENSIINELSCPWTLALNKLLTSIKMEVKDTHMLYYLRSSHSPANFRNRQLLPLHLSYWQAYFALILSFMNKIFKSIWPICNTSLDNALLPPSCNFGGSALNTYWSYQADLAQIMSLTSMKMKVNSAHMQYHPRECHITAIPQILWFSMKSPFQFRQIDICTSCPGL